MLIKSFLCPEIIIMYILTIDSIGNMSIKKIKILTDLNNDSTFVYILCRSEIYGIFI